MINIYEVNETNAMIEKETPQCVNEHQQHHAQNEKHTGKADVVAELLDGVRGSQYSFFHCFRLPFPGPGAWRARRILTSKESNQPS